MLLREDLGAVAHVEHPDPLWTLELVGANRDHVRAEGLDVQIDVGSGLDGVDMEEHALAAADDGRDFGDRLERADLVVAEHDRDEDRPVVDRGLELGRVNPAVPIDRQLDDLEPELLEVAERVADRVMLDRGGDDPRSARLARPRRSLDREVVRLGAAGREDDLACLGMEPGRDPLVRIVERRPCGAPKAVRAPMMRATVCSCWARPLVAFARVDGWTYCAGAATTEALKAAWNCACASIERLTTIACSFANRCWLSAVTMDRKLVAAALELNRVPVNPPICTAPPLPTWYWNTDCPAMNTALPEAEMLVKVAAVFELATRSPKRPPQPTLAPSGARACQVDC